MKKSLLFTALIMALNLCINAQTVVWEDNFDSYTAPTNLVDEGFVVWEGTVNAVDAAANGITAVSGANVAKCSSGASNNIYLRKTIQLEGGKQYTYSASTMQADGKKHFIQVVVDGTTLKAEGLNTTWESKSITFTPAITQDVVLTTYMYFKEMAMYVDDMKLVENTATSIDQNVENAFSISPNPSNGIFKVTGEQGIASCSVYNTAGQLVNSISVNNQTQANIDMTGFKSGLYIVQVNTTSGQTSISKAIVK